jgi:hypothetical protein
MYMEALISWGGSDQDGSGRGAESAMIVSTLSRARLVDWSTERFGRLATAASCAIVPLAAPSWWMPSVAA